MNLSPSLQFLSTFFTLAQGFFSSSLESTPPIIQKEEKDLQKLPLKKILFTPRPNGSVNSITIMTLFFLFFWVSYPLFFSSPSSWMGWGRNLLEIPSKICGMLYFQYPDRRKNKFCFMLIYLISFRKTQPDFRNRVDHKKDYLEKDR